MEPLGREPRERQRLDSDSANKVGAGDKSLAPGSWVILARDPYSKPIDGVEPDIWTIEECGDRDPTGARVGAILQVLLAREPAERRPTIRASLPPGFKPPQVTITAARPSADVMMVRPLTPAAGAARTLGADEILYWRGDLF